ncbi:lysine--tRNA ligase [Coprococcus eutactus]|nr:lysine--tRNA ligase [Coprococcus eutactus]EDP25995.1 lysine--tRNA ligase [Coprococcus eutactus ATCC 27759]UEA78968.1 lysine--tRNA ligase [Coprococcus eutactus ATCC 27759]UWP16649.1 lysine--tRNA ligase [Coprococcus eutactus]
MAEQNNKGNEQDLNKLKMVRREKLADLQAAGKDPFVITKYDVQQHSIEVKDMYTALEAELLAGRQEPSVEGLDEAEKREVINNDYNERRAIMDASPINVSIAGRMMFKRVMGKASFCNIQDLKGNIQVYVARDQIGEESYADFKKSDIGDIYGVKGYAFRTKMGEISIHAEEITLLSKSLQMLPEKFHGLTDTDMRYRQRYVDLIMNQDSKEVFIKRSQILKEIRNFLAGRDFMEVETPMLVSNAGGAAARPFETHYNALDEDVKLRISLELYLKRLIVGGLERVYEIGRVFRNEGVDTRHNPEFTLMELYQAYTDYYGMMELTESMFRYLAEKVCGSTKISYNGIEIDFGKPFERLTMVDAIKKYTGVDFDQVADDAEAKKIADEHHVEYEERHKKGDIVNLFFEEFCEENLIQPTFIMDHPIEISPLTKKKPSDPTKVERFELFINTWEMCNAYSELNDPIDQRERFAAQDANAAAGDDEAEHTDEDFLNALEIGMPPTGGIGYGIDRLVMLLTDSQAIRDVLLFPTMKSLDGVNKKNDVNNTASEAPEKNVKTESEKIDFSNVKIEPIFEKMVDFDTFAKSDFRAVKILACEAVPKSKKLLKFTLDDGERKDRVILSGIHDYYEPEELVGKTAIAIVNLPPRKMMGIDSEGMLISAVHEEDGHEGLNLLMVDDHIPAGAKLY